ncbi:hypothetical protein ACFE04_002293 [Oxalis oulophora]
MASFSIEDFVGNGVLKDLLPTLLDEGWDDVPTIKVMNSEDMEAINMTQPQKAALEIRTYLHDRALMQYAEKLEGSAKYLPEILNMSNTDLLTQFGMKRGHAARFTDRTSPCHNNNTYTDPKSYNPPARRVTIAPSTSNNRRSFASGNTSRIPSFTKYPSRTKSDKSIEQSIADFKIKDGYVFKGVVASAPAEPRGCGCVEAPPVVDQVASYSSLETISVQKLTPEYKIGMERLVKTKTPPMKASELWKDKPAVLLCIRRPGCIMCRAEAHQLYTRKPIFDALGVQLIAVIHEHIESEVKDFWPRYWGGIVLFDRSMEFFKALGGGKLLKDKFLSGFVFNPRAIANYKRAKATGIDQNFKGEGEIKGGLFIVGRGKSGIAYQFIERNFGDWAPLPEIIDICNQLQSHDQHQKDSNTRT